ncbi:hypothetical protein [Hymenobacter lapidiphilus]|uniref:Uncharacterized protein n=1 Tax=Hymenobacter lapidiphilus TaxID=2608003 RepID=A0A7Y7U609_9BACT|nr:hypothetical protein [Hymenobacter lapidiphilus]NVO32311.1 hypothetical protein [Hymenobacter lapidiphilus]
MAIRDISLGTAQEPHHRDFNSSTWALAQLYVTFLPAFDSAGIVKVNIGVVDTAGARDVASLAIGPVLRLLNVVVVGLSLDLSWYATLPDPARALLQLEVLHAACLAVGTAQQWDPQPFHAAYAQCQRANLANAWVIQVGKKRFVYSPDRRSKACLVCLWTLHSFRVDLVVMAKATGGAHVTPLLENAAYDPVQFHTVSWVDNQTVKVTARYPHREWQVEVKG